MAAPEPLLLYIDNAETLQDLTAAGPDERAPWRDHLVAGFFATLCGAAAGSVTILLTTRFSPIDTPGYWESISRCSNGEIFRMSAWWPVLQRLPWSVRADLADERLDDHPRAVEWVNSLLKLQEEETGQRVSPGGDPERVWRDLVEPALASLPCKIDQDLALDQVLARLAPPSRALLGECTAIGRPVPFDIVRRLGSAHQGKPEVLRDLGLLTRFAADEDAWAVHPFVAERAARAGLTWTPAGRAILGRYWRDREAGRGSRAAHMESLTEVLGHLAAGLCWSEASDLMSALSRTFRTAGWYTARLELLESITAWPDAQRVRWLCEHGYALGDMSQYDRAEQAFREALSLSEASARASGSRDVANSLHGLANLFESLGRDEDAEAGWREVIAIDEKIFGSRRTANTIPTITELAELLLRRGKTREALDLAQEAWDAALDGSHLLLAVQALSVLHPALEQSGAPPDQMAQLSEPLFSALQALPADDSLRTRIEQQLGLREDSEP